MSPGLQRARQPFRLRNAITGVVLAGFAVGVWAYSIGAVKQDKFDELLKHLYEVSDPAHSRYGQVRISVPRTTKKGGLK